MRFHVYPCCHAGCTTPIFDDRNRHDVMGSVTLERTGPPVSPVQHYLIAVHAVIEAAESW